MFERLQAQAMGEVIGQPFVLATLARGVPRARVIWRDALKAALRPVASIYGLVVGTLLSGSFAVEIITSWPGLGRLMLDALRARDVYLVAGCAAAGSVFLAAGTLLSDAALAVVDPRTDGMTRPDDDPRLGASSLGARRAVAALAAPVLAPHAIRSRSSPDLLNAPPTLRPRPSTMRGAGTRRSSIPGSASTSSSSATSRIESAPVPLVWFAGGRLVRSADEAARPCCSSAPTATAATCSAGCCSARGSRWGWRCRPPSARRSSAGSSARSPATPAARSTTLLMRASDFVLVLPAMYVALALRSVLPLVLAAGDGLPAAGRDLRRRRRAVHLARRARHRPHPSGGSTTRPPPRRSARATSRLAARGTCCRRRAASSPCS